MGIEFPILQAPIGSASCARLAAAVSNAGALGMLSVTWRSPTEVRRVLQETRALTDRPFGVNLVLAWDQQERLQICLEEGVRIFSFFWGDPGPYIERVHAAGGLAMHGVGSVAEAREALARGADVVIAQGWEAGGHVRGEVAGMVLTPAVVDAIHPVPVVAAGGVADGRGIAAAIALGAAGVSLGTRFLASEEAAVHPLYRQAVIEAATDDTVYTSLFDGGWENAPHRVLRNSTVRRWEAAGRPLAPYRPGEGEPVAELADGTRVNRYSDYIPLPEMRGDVESLALYAGQSAGLVDRILPAGEIVRTLVAEARAAAERTARVTRS